MKRLIILIGNIGTGKSTFAKTYQKKGYVIIARDQLRYAIGNGRYIFNPRYELAIWRTELYLFREFIDLGVDILVDEVGMNKLMRKRYIRYAKNNGYKITAIVMPKLSKKVAVERRMKNPHGQPDAKMWAQVWEKFNKMYERPTKKEGFDLIKVLKR